jgi:hypothetical protein
MIVTCALQSCGIRISASKVASLMKIALPEDWQSVPLEQQKVITMLVQKFFARSLEKAVKERRMTPEQAAWSSNHMSPIETSQFLPYSISPQEVEQFLAEIRNMVRVSLDNAAVKRLSQYVSRHWLDLIRTRKDTGNLETALDTVTPSDWHKPDWKI